MPNHITNILRIDGDAERVAACIAAISTEKTAEQPARFMDFNKIIPRPAELDISSGGLVIFLENQFTERNPVSQLKADILKADEAQIENLCQGIRNLKKFGSATWYGWSCENWGTKWNAYDQTEIDSGIQFDTAWSTPDPIFHKLSTSWPDLTFTVEYADEDIGSNCGKVIYRNGESELCDIGDADEFARRVKGYDDAALGEAA